MVLSCENVKPDKPLKTKINSPCKTKKPDLDLSLKMCILIWICGWKLEIDVDLLL